MSKKDGVNRILQKTGSQFFVYVPSVITEAMGWKKGTVLSCEILGKGKLKLEEVKDAKQPQEVQKV
jgi:hypothetical protein